jgi:hypothetical protein
MTLELNSRSEAINFLKLNGAFRASRSYSDMQITVLVTMALAKDEKKSIAETVKATSGPYPSFWTFLEALDIRTTFENEQDIYPLDFPKSLAIFCRKSCSGNINSAIDTIDHLVRASMARGYYDSEQHFKILSDFMRDVNNIVKKDKQRKERSEKNRVKASQYFFKPSLNKSGKNISPLRRILIADGIEVPSVLMPTAASPKVWKNLFGFGFCCFCHRPSVGTDIHCVLHKSNNRNERNFINGVYDKIVLIQENDLTVVSERFVNLNFNSSFPIKALLSDNLDLQARSTLIVKWINGCDETQSLIETLIASVEGMKIEFALDFWESQSDLMVREILKKLSESGYFNEFNAIGIFDRSCIEHGVEYAVRILFQLGSTPTPSEFLNIVNRYISFRMLQIFNEIK